MATTDAIAFLGDTIVSILQDGLSGLVAPGDIFLSTPDEFTDFTPVQPSVTIFLYHVAINAEMRNGPRRTFNGASRPPLPLELRFLITPWTTETRDAYRITGAVSQVMYDHAVLTFGELLGDEVWAPDDTVELMMESIPVEEYFDIWDPSEIPYKLSLSYLARVVGIDSALISSASPVAVAAFPQGTP